MNMPSKDKLVRGSKLDGAGREMWYEVKDGKKRRIGWQRAYARLNAGTAVETSQQEKAAQA